MAHLFSLKTFVQHHPDHRQPPNRIKNPKSEKSIQLQNATNLLYLKKKKKRIKNVHVVVLCAVMQASISYNLVVLHPPNNNRFDLILIPFCKKKFNRKIFNVTTPRLTWIKKFSLRRNRCLVLNWLIYKFDGERKMSMPFIYEYTFYNKCVRFVVLHFIYGYHGCPPCRICWYNIL